MHELHELHGSLLHLVWEIYNIASGVTGIEKQHPMTILDLQHSELHNSNLLHLVWEIASSDHMHSLGLQHSELHSSLLHLVWGIATGVTGIEKQHPVTLLGLQHSIVVYCIWCSGR